MYNYKHSNFLKHIEFKQKQIINKNWNLFTTELYKMKIQNINKNWYYNNPATTTTELAICSCKTACILKAKDWKIKDNAHLKYQQVHKLKRLQPNI